MKVSVGAWSVGIAEAVSVASEDPYCRVGAVLLSGDRLILGTGYNGPPAGVDIDWSDRAQRRQYVIHAEANALRLATPQSAAGGSLAVTHYPCADCVRLASAYGVRTIYWTHPADWNTYPREPIEQVARTVRVRLVETPTPTT